MMLAEDAALLERASQWPVPDLDALTPAHLAKIAQAHGIDFATALLHDRLLRVPENAEFARQVNSAPTIPPRSQLIGVVPGALFKEMSFPGAQRVLAILHELGLEAELIPVNSFGLHHQNAAAIVDWIQAHQDRSITLISLSKGSADLKTAFAQWPGEWAPVTDWISISGMTDGSPLVDWLRRRRLRWWAVRFLLWRWGHKIQCLEQMDTDILDWPPLPAHLRAFHVYGFPLKHHLHEKLAKRAYRRITPLGPNDGGGVLLAGLTKLPGIIHPIWGADHYLTPSWDVESRIRAVISAVLSGSPRQAT